MDPYKKVRPGERLAISARGWNRAQEAADKVLGGQPGFVETPRAGDPTIAVAYCDRVLFGEPVYLQYRNSRPGGPDVNRQRVTPYEWGDAGYGTANKEIISSGGLRGYGFAGAGTQTGRLGGQILGVSLDEAAEPGYRRFRISGKALVRVVAYTSTIDCSTLGTAGGITFKEKIVGGVAVRNYYLNVSPFGNKEIVVVTSLPATGLYEDPATGWGIVLL